MLSNYPPGAENDPSAPYNEPAPLPDKEFDVYCAQSLSKSFTVKSNEYIPEEDGVNTLDINWQDAFDNSFHFTPYELLQTFKEYLEFNLEHENFIPDCGFSKKFIEHLIEECSDWIIDSQEIGEE